MKTVQQVLCCKSFPLNAIEVINVYFNVYVTLETAPKFTTIEHPTSSQSEGFLSTTHTTRIRKRKFYNQQVNKINFLKRLLC